MKDFKRGEVIQLAEEIYIHKVGRKDVITNMMEIYAKQAIKAAMVFREIEQDLFKKGK